MYLDKKHLISLYLSMLCPENEYCNSHDNHDIQFKKYVCRQFEHLKHLRLHSKCLTRWEVIVQAFTANY